jgi:hypothetical protein
MTATVADTPVNGQCHRTWTAGVDCNNSNSGWASSYKKRKCPGATKSWQSPNKYIVYIDENMDEDIAFDRLLRVIDQ